jgi:Ca2+-transporting ATPase
MLIAIFASILTAIPLILVPAQILWVNLATNGLQDIALAFDPKEPDVEQRQPREPNEGVLNRTLTIRMFILGFVVAAVTLGVFILDLIAGHSLTHARTMALTTVVFAQFFHVFNSRSETTSVFRQNPLSNRFLFLSIAAAIIAQLGLVYLPFMQRIFQSAPLTTREFLLAIGSASLVLIGSEFDKWRARNSKSNINNDS